MESQDYYQSKQEEKEQKDREIYSFLLEEFKDALDSIFRQAKIDELETEDIEEAIEEIYNNLNHDDTIKVIEG